MNYEAKTLRIYTIKWFPFVYLENKLLGVYLDAVVDKDVSVEIKCSLLEGIMQQTRTTLSLLDI